MIVQDLDDLLSFVRDATNDDNALEVTHEQDVLASFADETAPDIGNEQDCLSALFDTSLVISGQSTLMDDRNDFSDP